MKFKLFQEVVLTKDIPEKRLKRSDVATIVEHHPVADGEDGYSLEIFNALGDTIAVVTVPESAIELMSEDEIFSVRTFIGIGNSGKGNISTQVETTLKKAANRREGWSLSE